MNFATPQHDAFVDKVNDLMDGMIDKHHVYEEDRDVSHEERRKSNSHRAMKASHRTSREDITESQVTWHEDRMSQSQS